MLARRRCYMDNLRKWGVRKYKRKTVVMHNPPPDDGTGVGRPPEQPGRQLGPSSSSTAQCLVLPDPAQPGQLQDWPCFPLDAWPVEPPPFPDTTPPPPPLPSSAIVPRRSESASGGSSASTLSAETRPRPPPLPARYLTAHRPQLGAGADQHVSASPDVGDSFLEQYLFRLDFSHHGLC